MAAEPMTMFARYRFSGKRRVPPKPPVAAG